MIQHSATLTGDYAVVEGIVHHITPRLRSYGLEFLGVFLEGSKIIGQFPNFRFLNRRSDVQINFLFSIIGADQGGGFVVLIENSEKRKLDVEDYLRMHKLDKQAELFSYLDSNMDIRSFVESFFHMFFKLLDTDLKPIINGERFEETPIDWMGYK